MSWKPLAVVLAFPIYCMNLKAADWPQWRGPERTGYVPVDVPIPKSLPDSPAILWHIPLGNGVASPVVSGGKVFYLDHQDGKEVVHASDAASGKVLWSVPLDDVQKDSQSPPGPRCTPTVDGNRVYAQSCRGELQCLDTADGKVIWRTNFVKDFGAVFIGEKGKAEGASRHGNTGSPLVDGEHLIAEVGGPGASIVCFDKKNGQVIWKSESDIPGYAAPIIATIAGKRQIIGFMADGLTAEQVEATLDKAAATETNNEADWLMTLFGGGASGSGEAQAGNEGAGFTTGRPPHRGAQLHGAIRPRQSRG